MTKPMIYTRNSDGYLQASEGILRKTLVYGANALLTEFRLEEGRILPRHRHPQEQVGYLVSGHIVLHVEADSFDVKPGDSWAIPGNIEHSADILEDSVAIEVFAPVREDYLP